MKVSITKKACNCNHCHCYSPVAKKVNREHTCPECAVKIFKTREKA